MLKKYLGTSDFARNLLALVSGTALAQVINFVFSTFITRIYTPDDFGAVSIFSSLVSFVLVISCAKFDVAIVAAREREDARKLFALANMIMVGTAILTLICSVCIYLFNVPFYANSVVRNWFCWSGLSVLLLTGGQVFWMWNVREKNFKNISFIRVLEALSAGLFSIVLKGFGAIGLLLATMTGQFLSFIALGSGIFKREGFKSFIYKTSELKQTFSDYSEFPKVNILQGFVDIFQVSAVVLILSAGGFAGEVIGYYALCMRVLQVPMRLIVLPVSHVFFSEASELHRNGGDLFRLVKKTILRTAAFTLPVPLVLIFFGPWLFSLVFGKNWIEAGVYAQIISGWIFFDLIRAPIAQIASIVGKQKQVLYVSVVSNLILLAVLLYGVHVLLRPRWILAMVSLSQGLMALFLIFLILKISRTK